MSKPNWNRVAALEFVGQLYAGRGFGDHDRWQMMEQAYEWALAALEPASEGSGGQVAERVRHRDEVLVLSADAVQAAAAELSAARQRWVRRHPEGAGGPVVGQNPQRWVGGPIDIVGPDPHQITTHQLEFTCTVPDEGKGVGTCVCGWVVGVDIPMTETDVDASHNEHLRQAGRPPAGMWPFRGRDGLPIDPLVSEPARTEAPPRNVPVEGDGSTTPPVYRFYREDQRQIETTPGGDLAGDRQTLVGVFSFYWREDTRNTTNRWSLWSGPEPEDGIPCWTARRSYDLGGQYAPPPREQMTRLTVDYLNDLDIPVETRYDTEE